MSNNYVIFTDSSCDIPPAMLEQWGVKTAQLMFRFDGEEKDYTNLDIFVSDFYERMRKGESAKTSAANTEQFKALFRPALEEGQDVLCLAFSSGLSVTCQAAMMAAEELGEEYPQRKVIVVDTLCASSGQGMLVWLAVEKKRQGASVEEVARYVEDRKLHLCHWFTVDDLTYLKRGGRVSPAVAFVGGMLGIKPVLHVDDEGHLISVSKVRGRKAALEALVNRYVELAEEPGKGPVFISQADSREDAEIVASLIKQKTGAEVDLISDVGPVIGSHSGPGTMALFFLGKHR